MKVAGRALIATWILAIPMMVAVIWFNVPAWISPVAGCLEYLVFHKIFSKLRIRP